MRAYAVRVQRAALRQIARLPKGTAARVSAAIERLADDPRPPGCKKLRGAGELWRIRVGRYRVVYAVDDGELVVEVVTAGHRSQVYR